MSDPFAPFDAIRDAIKSVIEPLGVELITWSVMPGDDPDDERACSVLMLIKPEAFFTDDEKAMSLQFKEIEEGERLLERQAKASEEALRARDDLLKISKDGIFDDAPEE